MAVVRPSPTSMRSTLTILRTRNSGHIVNVSSVSGLTSIPGWGLYCAGKHALEGLGEALAGEVAEFGVRATIVEPGYFRTDCLTTDSLVLPDTTSDARPAIRETVRSHLDPQGSQLGDPVKGARHIITNVLTGGGQLRQVLGSDSHTHTTAKEDAPRATLDATRKSAPLTDFAPA